MSRYKTGHIESKALITGITGQDGAYLSKFLLEKGYSVVGVSRSLNPNLNGLDYLGIKDDVKILRADLNSQEDVSQLIEVVQPDEIYNLAAQSSVGLSFQRPRSTLGFNISSTLNILMSIRDINPNIKFYQASSSEMFGNINKLPVKEDGHFHPSSPYGISKASAHWITINYREGYNLFACCGILFNHESALRGQNYVTSKIIQSALKIKEGKGEKLRLGNLNIYRDWGYAPKYVEAMWTMLQQKKAKDYLICSNNIMSLEDFAREIFDQLGLDYNEHIQIDPDLIRAVDLERMQGDNSKAKNELNWDYTMSNSELISKLIEDFTAYNQWVEKKK